MDSEIHLLDVVALVVDLPEHGIYCGQVGTVVEVLAPGVFEVEFVGNYGHTYALATLKQNQLMRLRHEPVATA